MEKTDRTERQDKEVPESTYDAAWQEAEQAESGAPVSGQAEPAEPAEPAEDEAHPAGEQEASPEGQNAEPAEDPKKAIRDAKAHAGLMASRAAAVAAENRELKARLASLSPAAGEHNEKAPVEVYDETVKRLYDDYPELRAVIEPLVEIVKRQSLDVRQISEDVAPVRAEADRVRIKTEFERDVKPAVVEEHPDFDEIVAGKEYWTWAEKQPPAIRFAAVDSGNPDDIRGAIRLFKRDAAGSEDTGRAGLRRQLASSMRGGAGQARIGGRIDQNDYDAGWAEAEAADRGAIRR